MCIDTQQKIPKIKFCISINTDLSYELFCNGCVLLNGKVQHLAVKATIRYSADVMGILNFLNDSCAQENTMIFSPQFLLY